MHGSSPHHLVRPLWHGWFDLMVYRGAVRSWAHGQPLYSFHRDTATESYGFTYPPFAAVALAPRAGRLAAVGLADERRAPSRCVVVATWGFLGPVARRAGWSPVFTVAAASRSSC